MNICFKIEASCCVPDAGIISDEGATRDAIEEILCDEGILADVTITDYRIEDEE